MNHLPFPRASLYFLPALTLTMPPPLTLFLHRSLGSGKYQTETGQTACDSCAAGSYSALSGSAAQSDCEACPAGGFCAAPGARRIVGTLTNP